MDSGGAGGGAAGYCFSSSSRPKASRAARVLTINPLLAYPPRQPRFRRDQWQYHLRVPDTQRVKVTPLNR